jgi:LPS export ABC transporter protein LptC|tara:strand:+ start:33 stop:578 length:546 start_codon:yes stop_codon:yes gene_type:complete
MKTPSGFLFYLHLIFSIFYMGCDTSDDTLTESISEMEDISTQVITSGEFVYSEKGDVKNILEAGRLERSDDTEIWDVSEGFRLFIGGDKSDHQAILSGGRGNYDPNSGHLIALDGVELVNLEGERLNTEYLVWSHDSDKVHTDRPVSIHTSTGILHGKGLEADSRFEHYRIIDPTGSFNLP